MEDVMSGEGENTGAETTGDGADGTTGGESTTDTGQTTDTGAQGGENGTAEATVSRAEFEALMKRMQAADKRASAAEKKVSDAEKAKLDELDRAKLEAQEAKDEADKMKAEVRNAKLFNAFLADKTNAWHDVEDAYTLLQAKFMDGVDVDDDGKVKGMDAAIKAMAKAKPHLVNTTQTSEATGSEHNGRRKGDNSNAVDKTEMAKRFPAAFLS